jgi:hypothetical protein
MQTKKLGRSGIGANVLRFVYPIIFIFISSGLYACGGSSGEESSRFFKTFTIGEIVEANKQYLSDSPRTLSGSEAGPPEPFLQRHEEMIVQIDPADLPEFIDAMKIDVAEAITSSGATVQGTEYGGLETIELFGYSYQADSFYGVITIWSVQGEGTDLHIIVMITES